MRGLKCLAGRIQLTTWVGIGQSAVSRELLAACFQKTSVMAG